MPAGGPVFRTDAGRLGWEALLTAPAEALVALDYDGTLAPIVDDPSAAVPLTGAVDVLVDLAARVGRLAVVTGRAAEAVVPLGGLDRVPGLVVMAQYGVQRWSEGTVDQDPPATGLVRAREVLATMELAPGVVIEDKGLSLAVHTRRAEEPLLELARLHPVLSGVADAAGLALHLGRMVLELRPPGRDKGRALRELLRDRSVVLFAGDDLGDLAGLAEVEGFRSRGGLGLVVCSDSPEGPAELRDGADVVVPGPGGVVGLLSELLAALGEGGE